MTSAGLSFPCRREAPTSASDPPLRGEGLLEREAELERDERELREDREEERELVDELRDLRVARRGDGRRVTRRGDVEREVDLEESDLR